MSPPVARRILWPLCLAAALVAILPSPASGAEFDQQRALFRQVYASVERGNWSVVADLATADRRILERYTLWPDLRAAYFRAAISSTPRRDIDAFLEQYGTLKPARELRYHYALDRVRRGDLAAYLKIYESFYQGLEIAKLDCLAFQAELDAGRTASVVNRARALWLIGESQVNECDPVFEFLADNNQLSPLDYRHRYELAVDAREFSLAKWLGKSINAAHVDDANHWLSAAANPKRFLLTHSDRRDNEVSRRQLAYAVGRLTYADPVLALELWSQVRNRYAFSDELKLKTARHIALWTARDNLNDAYAMLSGLPRAAQNDEVMRWRARLSLRSQAWLRLLDDIAAMSEPERSTEEWRYWRARALARSGQVNAARAEFEELAAKRSYYGFLAADEVNVAYAYEHSDLDVDEAMITALSARPDLIRARELFRVGLDSRGRSEWDDVVGYFTPEQKAHAAVLADRWGWHSRAISTAASIGEYDDLALRYPLPYQSTFKRHALAASISATWAYGIARSESLFMRDIRSSAGAVGLMQLMPATGRKVAREINLPYSGLDTLTDPQSNIRLGTAYLSQMSARYGGNRVLATAAYNAGPHRVDRWMPDEGSMDARIWIENIPFNETRKYVRRVIAAEAIFYWRINGETQRLNDRLPNVEAQIEERRVASR